MSVSTSLLTKDESGSDDGPKCSGRGVSNPTPAMVCWMLVDGNGNRQSLTFFSSATAQHSDTEQMHSSCEMVD